MENQLVSFGNYLLSKERRKIFKAKQVKGLSINERLSGVHHADLGNWKELTN